MKSYLRTSLFALFATQVLFGQETVTSNLRDMLEPQPSQYQLGAGGGVIGGVGDYFNVDTNLHYRHPIGNGFKLEHLISWGRASGSDYSSHDERYAMTVVMPAKFIDFRLGIAAQHLTQSVSYFATQALSTGSNKIVAHITDSLGIEAGIGMNWVLSESFLIQARFLTIYLPVICKTTYTSENEQPGQPVWSRPGFPTLDVLDFSFVVAL